MFCYIRTAVRPSLPQQIITWLLAPLALVWREKTRFGFGYLKKN